MSDRIRKMLRHGRLALMALLLPGIVHLAQAQAQETKDATPKPEAIKAGMPKGETAKYECAYVHPKGEKLPFDYCPNDGSADAKPDRAGRVLTPENGDIVVVIKAPLYVAAMKAMDTKPLQLSLNGWSMAESAQPMGSPPQGAQFVRLRFGVTQVDTTGAKAFWSNAYKQVGFGALKPLTVTLGWKEYPHYFQPNIDDGIPDMLYIASIVRMGTAWALGFVVVGGFLWALFRSDIFRVGPGYGVAPNMKRQAFSFARVQWGVWSTFALASAVFLWTVYGVFLPLSEQMLGLAGVSTLSATTSFFMDSGKQPGQPVASDGLWNDLLSGVNDSTAQAHRFQALAVNVVLLVVAGAYVYQHLDFPVIPSTWLAMLGLSNAAQLAGKQALETSGGGTGPSQPLPPATVPGGPPTGALPPTQQQNPPPATVPGGPTGGFQQSLQQALPPATLPAGPP